VVLAAGPQHAAPLLAASRQAAESARLLAGYGWEPIGTVYCGYSPEVRLPLPMLGLAALDAASSGSGFSIAERCAARRE
jgi:hypothetical protein